MGDIFYVLDDVAYAVIQTGALIANSTVPKFSQTSNTAIETQLQSR